MGAAAAVFVADEFGEEEDGGVSSAGGRHCVSISRNGAAVGDGVTGFSRTRPHDLTAREKISGIAQFSGISTTGHFSREEPFLGTMEDCLGDSTFEAYAQKGRKFPRPPILQPRHL